MKRLRSHSGNSDEGVSVKACGLKVNESDAGVIFLAAVGSTSPPPKRGEDRDGQKQSDGGADTGSERWNGDLARQFRPPAQHRPEQIFAAPGVATDSDDVQRRECDEYIKKNRMQLLGQLRLIVRDETGKRSGIQTILVGGKQSQQRLNTQKAHEQRDAPAAERIVPDIMRRATGDVRHHLARTAQKIREAGRLRAGKAPEQAKSHQRENAIADEAMQCHLIDLIGPPGKRNENDKRPMDGSDENVPDQNALGFARHCRQSRTLKSAWQASHAFLIASTWLANWLASPAFAASTSLAEAVVNSLARARKPPRLLQISALAPVSSAVWPGPVPSGNSVGNAAAHSASAVAANFCLVTSLPVSAARFNCEKVTTDISYAACRARTICAGVSGGADAGCARANLPATMAKARASMPAALA